MTVTVQQTVILYRPTTNIYFSPLITPPVSRSTPPPADQLICERYHWPNAESSSRSPDAKTKSRLIHVEIRCFTETNGYTTYIYTSADRGKLRRAYKQSSVVYDTSDQSSVTYSQQTRDAQPMLI